jgi:uncharacterized membrane protein YfcA
MNKKLFKKILRRIDLFALVGVLVGVVLLGQPISKVVFMIGFPLILFCTALHMVLDHYV